MTIQNIYTLYDKKGNTITGTLRSKYYRVNSSGQVEKVHNQGKTFNGKFNITWLPAPEVKVVWNLDEIERIMV